jgi:preprotein translocase subunit SecA
MRTGGSATGTAGTVRLTGAGTAPAGNGRNGGGGQGQRRPATILAGGAGAGVLGGNQQARPGYTPSGAKIGRNDACWCGSGLKYKKCHGK